jgi:Leucine-rich repeat (LRR) protein
LTNLTELDLWSNAFTGTLPSELGQLTALIQLSLFDNEFTGSLPSCIGDMKALTLLWISYNNFSGMFPSKVANKVNLEEFCAIKNNKFTDVVPADIETKYTCP